VADLILRVLLELVGLKDEFAVFSGVDEFCEILQCSVAKFVFLDLLEEVLSVELLELTQRR